MFEIIKNTVEIESEKLIKSQIKKLKKFELGEKISSFVDRLQNYNYRIIIVIKQYFQNIYYLKTIKPDIKIFLLQKNT
ncbi:hypothetical protein [Nautilia sp. PV-1]|uniref:hypothetical protein n=1 Tax=Nautilia sp. PV-1 TaxID=2579250 RepID=UPI00143B4D54|nr:hypothetical protein [Nautilia sp. PV-1]